MRYVRSPSGLLVPASAVPNQPVTRLTPALLTQRARQRTVTLANGERAKITWDDSGTVRHTEHGDRLDVTVIPKTIRVRMRVRGEQ